MTAPPARPRVTRVLILGIALAAAYTAVLVGTLRFDGPERGGAGASKGRVRPLYDGFAPPTPYRWVDPPPEFEDGNVKPRPSTTEVPIGPDGFKASGATTEDGQLVLNLPDGAVAPRPGDTDLRIVITPLAPGKLGPLPPGLFADGNVYKVELTYRPSGQAIDTLAKPGQILLTVPVPAVAVVFSPDGRAWERLQTTTGTGSTTGPVSAFGRGGHYLGAADHPTAVPDQGDSGGTGTVLVVAVLTAALVVALVVVPMLLHRARRRPAKSKAGQRPRPAPAKSKPKSPKGGRPKPSSGRSGRAGAAKKNKKKRR